jgi:teichuronic acid biosynthesis glycosyltransferase TuaC
MRILSISSLFPTVGLPNHGIFVYNRLQAMAEEGADITVINPLPDSPVHRVLKKYRDHLNAPDHRQLGLLSVYHPRFLSLPKFGKQLEQHTCKRSVMRIAERLHAERRFDAIDVHWTYPDLPAAVALAKKWGVPVTLTLRGMEAFYNYPGDTRQHVIQACLSEVDHIISLSHEMAVHADSLANTADKTSIVRNGADTITFTYQPQETVRQTLGLNPDATILLGVGSIIARKGFQHVIRAMSILEQRHPERHFEYHILGSTGLEGDFEQELHNMVATMGLQDKVFMHGSVPNAQLPQWYNAADLFCLSSFGEGSPNVLSEALSCGCPAIASDVGSVPDIMQAETDLGSIIPNQQGTSNDDAGWIWKDAIIDLLSSAGSREQRARRMAKYSWAWCAQQAIKALQKTQKGD